MSAEDIEYDDFKLFPTRESAIDWLQFYLSADEIDNLIKALSVEPCEDAISRKAVHDMLENLPVTVEDKWFNWLQKACLRLADLPSVQPKPKTGHCKDCKYFKQQEVLVEDSMIPLIAVNVCNKWGNGCETCEDGYCFMFEPQESEDK